MADKFRTGDTALTGSVTYFVSLPNTEWFVREFSDLLADIAEDENWEKVGAVTVENAVAAGLSAYWSFSKMIGLIVPYITEDPPTNSLPCDGTMYARVDYPALYDILDPVFIIDVDQFQVPDLRGRTLVCAGQSSGLSDRFVSEVGGEETHVLVTSETPSHTHSTDGHAHFTHSHITSLAVEPGEMVVSIPNPLGEYTSSANEGIQSTGDDGAHENMQPFIALNYAVIAR